MSLPPIEGPFSEAQRTGEQERHDLEQREHKAQYEAYIVQRGTIDTLTSKIQELSVKVAAIVAGLNVIQAISAIIATGLVVVAFNTCTRAVDNETQIKVNTGRLTSLELAKDDLLTKGSVQSQVNATEVIGLKTAHTLTQVQIASLERGLADLKEQVAIHINEDNRKDKQNKP